jgi:alkylated DNA repair dioxygenase AlkB
VFDREYTDLVAAAPSSTAPTAVWQGSLFDAIEPVVDPDLGRPERLDLDHDCWVDQVPGWLRGADTLFAVLHGQTEWRCPVVDMYDKRLPQPRLSAWSSWAEAPSIPVLAAMRDVLSHRYGVDFDSLGLNLYRDGRDSVAWHGDRHARTQRDPLVAIVSLGSARPFLLRPKGGGPSVRLVPHPGDLLVMGGACQHRWEHCVPKVRAAGPRLSVTFRHSGPVPGSESLGPPFVAGVSRA